VKSPSKKNLPRPDRTNRRKALANAVSASRNRDAWETVRSAAPLARFHDIQIA
jgi:hypothetical protein